VIGAGVKEAICDGLLEALACLAQDFHTGREREKENLRNANNGF